VGTEELRITYRRSGGFAGVALEAQCRGADLPEDQAQLAADLLAAPEEAGMPSADAEGAVASSTGPGPGADQFTHRLEVVQGARRRTVSWSDTTIPDAARPLLATLAGLARPTRNA
jgi:hypothetical protein